MSYFRSLFLFCLFLTLFFRLDLPTWAANAGAFDEDSRPTSLTVINYITGWAHDAAGYHPAIYMLLDNTSAKDLSTTQIRFQGKFTDLETGEVRTGRKEVRVELKPNQHIPIGIEAPYAYILPIETYNWPLLECKVMMRVGNAGDEGTETLLITKIDSVTRFEEEAFQILNQSSGYDPSLVRQRQLAARQASQRQKAKPVAREPEKPSQSQEIQKPLVAKADRLARTSSIAASTNSTLKFLEAEDIPKLGDDFYNFEQKFGLPLSTETNELGWTLAKYQDKESLTNIIVGSKKNTGKADLVIIELPKTNLNQNTLLDIGANLAKQKIPSNAAPKKSVRYITDGRLEITLLALTGKQVELLKLNNSNGYDNSGFLVVSREAQNPDNLLSQLSKKSKLLKLFKLWFAS